MKNVQDDGLPSKDALSNLDDIITDLGKVHEGLMHDVGWISFEPDGGNGRLHDAYNKVGDALSLAKDARSDFRIASIPTYETKVVRT